MLGVEKHPAPVGLQERDGVADHREVFFARDSQDVADVEVPTLPNDGDGAGLGFQERAQAGIVLGAGVRAAGVAEGHYGGVAKRLLANLGEERRVLGIRERIPPLDIVHTELVEAACHRQLVHQREGHPLGLGAVAQGRVVDGDPLPLPAHESTSGLTMFGGRSPRSIATIFVAARMAMRVRVPVVALPRWGRRTALGNSARPGANSGSFS